MFLFFLAVVFWVTELFMMSPYYHNNYYMAGSLNFCFILIDC